MRLAPFASSRSVPLGMTLVLSLLSFLIGVTLMDLRHLPLSALQPNLVWGLLLIGLSLSLPYAWRRRKATLRDRTPESPFATGRTTLRDFLAARVDHTILSMLLGPAIGLFVWYLPLGLDPAGRKTCAIVVFMVLYWMTAPIEYGLTALIGCFLFWATDATTFTVAFSGFTSSVPWFVFGALLLGQAAARTGLAARLGYIIMQRMGGSYSRLLFGLILLALLLQFLVPSPNAQISILASVAIGFVSAFDVGPRSNVAKGLFLALTYASYLFSRMFLAGGPAILTRGIIEEQTGAQILWSQWALAFLPLTLLTLVTCWLLIYWLYPPETPTSTAGPRYIPDALQAMGPWSWPERKALGWMVLAIALWGTDFLHHTHPALIGIGVGLILTLPKVGVLDKAAVKSVDFLLLVFLGGAISLGNVLVETHVLASATQVLVDWINPLLSSPLSAAISLYWCGFLYHIPVANANAMVSTALPILLSIAEAQQYNPLAVGLLWLFASAGTLFVYQASSFVLGYSYGYFDARDLLKVGALLSVIEGLFIMVLVPLYWPLIGLPWRSTPQAAASPVTPPLASGVYVPNPTSIGALWASGAHLRVTWAQVERQPGQFDWHRLEQHPAFVEAVRANKKVGFQVDIQGTPGKPALPTWVQVPQIGVAVGGTTRIWPAVWSPEFQTAFARFIKALAQRYDGDSRLAYVVMTEGTAVPYTVDPTQWDTAGYRAEGYSAAYQQLYETYLQAFAHTPLVAAISWFGQESRGRLEGGTEAQALRALLDFAGQHGLHVLVPDVYTRRAVRRIYVRDQILLPTLRQYADRSHLLVKLDPAEARGMPWGPQTLQMAQALWPGVPVAVVIPTQ